MYSPKRSLSERSGAVTLTLLLTAAPLGAVLALFAAPMPQTASTRAMRIFDVSAESIAPEPEPDSESAIRSVVQPEISAPSPVPVVAPKPVRPVEVALGPPVTLAVAGPIQAAPAAAENAARPASTGAESSRAAKPTERREEADQYGRAVFREIRARQSYPAELARAGLTGTVVVELKVSSRGRVYAVVAISSENAALDRLALAQVQATLLPPPPRGEPRVFRIPMTYRSR